MSANRDKVIKGLECCTSDRCDICSYDINLDCPGFDPTPKTLLRDALELLKAQEPRVMTLDELRELAISKLANNDEIVWAEDNGSDDCCDGYCSPDLGYPNDSIIVLWEPGNDCSYMPNMADYGARWRCWTSRPTDEQREATPWERLI